MIVKITDQHEWLRLAITETKERKLSLIWSYRGDRVTGIGLGKEIYTLAMRKWSQARDACETTLGDAIKRLAAVAEKSQSIEQFLEAI